MARKKKETAEEVKETVEIVATETAEKKPAKKTAPKKTEEKTETAEMKKPVRRGRKPAAKKAEEKPEEAQQAPTGTPMTADEKKEEIAPAAAETVEEKPKRTRKPAKKEPKEEKKEEKEPVAIESAPEKKTATRAEKNEAIRGLIKELLTARAYKWSELLDECAKLFEERIEDKEAHSANDVRGRIGSVFDLMKKENEVTLDGGMYALKGEETAKKVEEKQPENTEISSKKEAKKEEKTAEKQLPSVKEPAKLAPVFDMTLLFGAKEEKKGGKVEPKPISEKKEELKKAETAAEKLPAKTEEKPAEKPKKPIEKVEKAEKTPKKTTERKPQRTTEEKLKESFLRKIRSLGGKYFEYYSVYLLERYSLRNGRRIDGLKVSGGDHDGGIDGEIEVTDRIGFRETIYIQAKNWNPNCGKQESWVIGETNLQQFIGAVAYRQAKEGKQNCRGIFVTSSYFTAGAKEMLEEMSDKFVGYDGDDLFEAAKECSFGLIQKDGQWVLDEKLLAGDKAFFNLY